METIQLSEVGVEAVALRAAEVLRAGGVVLYPTDTLYGLGADALSDTAVAKVKRIKGRDEGKPIHAILEDVGAANGFAVMNDTANILANTFWPGALTLVVKKKPEVASGIGRDIDTFGIRVPNHAFCRALAREFAGPYTGTSANRSGERPLRDVENIRAQLGEAAGEIGLIIDAGELPERPASTVVDVQGEPVILRVGSIASGEIWDAVRAEL